MVSQLLCLHDCTGPSYEWSCLKILHQLSGLLFQLGGIFGQQVCFPFSLIHFEWTWMVFFAYSAVPWKRNKHPVPDKHSVPTVNKCPWALNQIITVDRCHSLGCHGHLLHLVACTNLSVTFPPLPSALYLFLMILIRTLCDLILRSIYIQLLVYISLFSVGSNPSNLRGKINPFNGKLFSDRYFDILKKRIELPVWEYREKFMETMKEKQAFVLVGETGSGKTTQVIISCIIWYYQLRW